MMTKSHQLLTTLLALLTGHEGLAWSAPPAPPTALGWAHLPSTRPSSDQAVPPERIGYLVSVTPSTPPSAAAAQLRRLPAGQRGLLMLEFAEDLALRDTITTKQRGRTLRVPSPWLTSGTRIVSARVGAWAAALASTGIVPDLVVISNVAGSRFLAADAIGGSAWSALKAARPRSAMLKAVPSTRTEWAALYATEFRTALSRAVVSPIAARFPGAKTAVRTGATAVQNTTAARTTIISGDIGCVRVLAAAGPASNLESFVATIRAARAAGPGDIVLLQPALLSIPDPEPIAEQPARSLGRELVLQLLVTGCGAVVADGVSAAHSAAEVLAEACADFERQVQGRPISRLDDATDPQIDASIAVAGAVRVGNDVLWRITLPSPSTPALVRFSDGTEKLVRSDSAAAGVWIEHPIDIGVTSIGPVPATQAARPRILYDEAPTSDFVCPVQRAEKYLIVYQNNGDPRAQRTCSIDPASVATEVQRLLALDPSATLGVLDFEFPFDAVFAAGSSDPRYGPMVASMIETLRVLRRRFPGISWTYYGVPRLPYWNPEGVWPSLSAAQREEIFQRSTAAYAPLLNEIDWVMPSLYDVYERALGMPTTAVPRSQVEADFRRAYVQCVRRYYERIGRVAKPIIPVVSPWFQNVSNVEARFLGPIPVDEFAEEQVSPALEAGVDGIAVWGSMGYALRVAFYTQQSYSPGFPQMQQKFRAALLGTVGAEPAPDWGSQEAAQALGMRVNQTLSTALELIDSVSTPESSVSRIGITSAR
jgi:hypothetical protein